jgi:hypothetical protein
MAASQAEASACGPEARSAAQCCMWPSCPKQQGASASPPSCRQPGRTAQQRLQPTAQREGQLQGTIRSRRRGARLAADHHDARHKLLALSRRGRLDLVVAPGHGEQVEVLALVLVDALDLDVVQRRGRQRDARALLQRGGRSHRATGCVRHAALHVLAYSKLLTLLFHRCCTQAELERTVKPRTVLSDTADTCDNTAAVPRSAWLGLVPLA